MNTISAQVGIYITAYLATFHRDGSITVRAPYIKWTGNNGCLAFRKVTVEGQEADAVREFFKAESLVMAANCFGGALTLNEVLDGDMRHGVRVVGKLQ